MWLLPSFGCIHPYTDMRESQRIRHLRSLGNRQDMKEDAGEFCVPTTKVVLEGARR
jgi:hypothetical protein